MSPRGELVIAAPLMFGRYHVLPIVMELLKQSDDVNVRLVLSDTNANLLEENIDVAVRIGALPDSGLTARRLDGWARSPESCAPAPRTLRSMGSRRPRPICATTSA